MVGGWVGGWVVGAWVGGWVGGWTNGWRTTLANILGGALPSGELRSEPGELHWGSHNRDGYVLGGYNIMGRYSVDSYNLKACILWAYALGG